VENRLERKNRSSITGMRFFEKISVRRKEIQDEYYKAGI
jgi:hypothetical protein